MAEIRMIDMNTWPRAEHYLRFTEDSPCAASLADEIDVTELYYACRASGSSFYLSVLWLVSAVVNAHEEFRMTAVDSPDVPRPMPGVWDVVHPAHNVFHEDTETYTSTFTLFSPDPVEFAERAAEDIERAKRLKTAAVPTPPNVFEASCVPWRHFTWAGASSDGVSLAPLIVWGRVRESGGRVFMPVSVSVSHAAADGFHLARFLNETEAAGKVLSGKKGGGIL